MDNSNDPLCLLQNELPDPCQNLFFQPLHAFNSFPELPFELRLIVWRETFPRARHMWPIAGSKLAQGLCTLGYPVAPVSSFINKESRSETLKHYQALKMSRKLANLPACMENRPSLNGCVLWNNKRDILRANWLTVSFCEVHSLLSKDFFVFQGANFVNSIEILELTIETWFPDFFSVGNLVSPTEENHNFWMEDMIGLSELRLISKTRKNATTSEQFTYEKAKMCIERLTKLFRDLTDKDSARKVPKIVLYEPPKTARL